MTPAAEHARCTCASCDLSRAILAAAKRGDTGHPAFTDAEERRIAAEQARRDEWVGDDRRRQQAADNWTERELDERRTR